jgi:hypothetical protein
LQIGLYIEEEILNRLKNRKKGVAAEEDGKHMQYAGAPPFQTSTSVPDE